MILKSLRLGPLLFTYDAARALVTIDHGEDRLGVEGVNLHEWAQFADAADKGLQAMPLRIRASSSRGA